MSKRREQRVILGHAVITGSATTTGGSARELLRMLAMAVAALPYKAASRFSPRAQSWLQLRRGRRRSRRGAGWYHGRQE